jgi:hypothetical protein
LPAATQDERRRSMQQQLAYQRDKDRQLVKGRFKYYDCPGGEMKFSFKQYKGDPVAKYELLDGQVYSIPLGVARHLNKNCFYTVHKHAVDNSGNPSQIIGQKIQRCEFVPLEFVDIEDLSPAGSNIVTVENI